MLWARVLWLKKRQVERRALRCQRRTHLVLHTAGAAYAEVFTSMLLYDSHLFLHTKEMPNSTRISHYTFFVLRFSKHSSSDSSKDGQSQDEPELPKELTEDWVTMEICVDCKKFITEIITSSKRSLCVATKRARLNRKTQSFYMSSSNSVNFRPSERSIKEV